MWEILVCAIFFWFSVGLTLADAGKCYFVSFCNRKLQLKLIYTKNDGTERLHILV